jgi:hypothetical protein
MQPGMRADMHAAANETIRADYRSIADIGTFLNDRPRSDRRAGSDPGPRIDECTVVDSGGGPHLGIDQSGDARIARIGILADDAGQLRRIGRLLRKQDSEARVVDSSFWYLRLVRKDRSPGPAVSSGATWRMRTAASPMTVPPNCPASSARVKDLRASPSILAW